ncbi:MAG TPA: DUF72 domain-containing protein [Stellaceae bacterium]|nr:DUF72 domain-containing protein [Stellaceae bacterium]
MSRQIGHVRVGISGWNYRGWRGGFYPKGLRQRDELSYAAERLDSIEINGTFYSLQRPASFVRWREATPPGFVFAVKGSRFITHMKQLHDIETPLANFFASGVLALADKLGPFLWQFSPRFRFDEERLHRFLALLPRDSKAAAALARRHDQRLAGRAVTEVSRNRSLRHAVEIRHASFLDLALVRLLRRHNVALAFADTPSWPYAEDVTADFLYLRMHGSETIYASGYSDEAIERWAARIKIWAAGGAPNDARLIDRDWSPRRIARDVYVYFDNDAWGHAPFDAQALRANLMGSA